MKLLGQGLYWQEMPVGAKFKTFGRTITETDIVNFISCTGFLEVLFTDMEFVKNHSAIQGRVAPGALVYALAEGMTMLGTIQGTGLAFLHMELDVKGADLRRRHHPLRDRSHRAAPDVERQSRPRAHAQYRYQPARRDGARVHASAHDGGEVVFSAARNAFGYCGRGTASPAGVSPRGLRPPTFGGAGTAHWRNSTER